MLTERQADQAWVEADRAQKLAAANRLVAVEPDGGAPAVYVRDSIVAPGGSVPPISTEPSPHWKNRHV